LATGYSMVFEEVETYTYFFLVVYDSPLAMVPIFRRSQPARMSFVYTVLLGHVNTCHGSISIVNEGTGTQLT
jgi:hypothetical protein